MSENKKNIDLARLASNIQDIISQLKQLDERQIEELKKLLDEKYQHAGSVQDEYSEYFNILSEKQAPTDTLTAQISLSSSEKNALFDELTKRELTLNQLLNSLIQDFLHQNVILEEGAILTDDDPIWQIVGTGRFDITDGSINHDHYIYGTPKREK